MPQVMLADSPGWRKGGGDHALLQAPRMPISSTGFPMGCVHLISPMAEVETAEKKLSTDGLEELC